jgi:hypothetical protein
VTATNEIVLQLDLTKDVEKLKHAYLSKGYFSIGDSVSFIGRSCPYFPLLHVDHANAAGRFVLRLEEAMLSRQYLFTWKPMKGCSNVSTVKRRLDLSWLLELLLLCSK